MPVTGRPRTRRAWRLAREAGAVMLGKTVTTEFALRHPGPTANPHNPAHTPGGSSSGSAAAVADFMVPVAFGTQTGGSIIRPASYCGVVGYKPSFDTINPTGVKPLAGSFDTVGLFARSVDDCALVVGVLAGEDRSATPLAGRSASARGPLAHARLASRRSRDGPSGRDRRGAARARGCAGGRGRTAGGVRALSRRAKRRAAFRGGARVRVRTDAARRPAYRRRAATSWSAGAAIPRRRYLEAQALLARCRTLFAAAIAPFDVLLSASAPGEAPAGSTTPARRCSTDGGRACTFRASICRASPDRMDCRSAFR